MTEVEWLACRKTGLVFDELREVSTERKMRLFLTACCRRAVGTAPDTGCDNDYILNHCRDPQAKHVRGCWAIDLVLGKE